MRKISAVLFACLFAVLCLSACGKGVQTPDPSPSQSEEAAAVELLICGLPQAGIPSEGQYLAAKERFDALTEREQRSVSNADKLTDGLAEIASCKRILAVSEAIDALPEVQSLTQADDGDILAARAAYDALTEAERPRVGNYGKLIEAELCRGMVPTLDGMQSIYRYDGIAGGKLAFRVDDFVELYREGMPKAEEGVSYENGILTLSAEYMNALTYGVSRFEAVTSSGSSIAFKILKYSDNYRFFDADTLVYNTPDGNNIARPRVVDSGIDGKSFKYDFAGKENGTYIIAYDSNGNLGIEKFDCKKDHTYLFQFDIEMLDEPLSESNNFILTFEYLFNVLYQRRSNSLYVENQVGVLSKISGLFSGKSYNLDSLTVGTTEDPTVSRMTIATVSDDETFEQIKKQLNRMIEVIKVIDFTDVFVRMKEILYIKVKGCSPEDKVELFQIAETFKARVIDYGKDSLLLEFVQTATKNDAVIKLIKEEFKHIEVVRGGSVGIESISMMER